MRNETQSGVLFVCFFDSLFVANKEQTRRCGCFKSDRKRNTQREKETTDQPQATPPTT